MKTDIQYIAGFEDYFFILCCENCVFHRLTPCEIPVPVIPEQTQGLQYYIAALYRNSCIPGRGTSTGFPWTIKIEFSVRVL